MRIASLVPSATEALYALGLGDQVVAVTHECDYPPEVSELPRLTSSVIPEGLHPAEIDEQVRAVTAQGDALYGLDEELLAELRPDLIVTQALCAVCAVSHDEVRAVADRLPSHPEVISLDPVDLDEVLGDLVRLGAAVDEPERGIRLRSELETRLRGISAAVDGAARPRVAALEWLDPPFIGGHWVPEMIELAGGYDALGTPAVKSRTVAWSDVAGAEVDLAVLMPCGLYVDEAAEQAVAYRERLRDLGARVVAVDAASSFSRPGPRLTDGVELLAHLLHPELVAAPTGLGWRELEWASPAAVGTSPEH